MAIISLGGKRGRIKKGVDSDSTEAVGCKSMLCSMAQSHRQWGAMRRRPVHPVFTRPGHPEQQ